MQTLRVTKPLELDHEDGQWRRDMTIPFRWQRRLRLFPTPSSTTAEQVDNLFYFILLVSVIFFAIIVGVMVLFSHQVSSTSG